ncbi:hypothetical protein K8352_07930 [Flavobacteriaceae bacterium F89]|uniref:Lipoprotein n=1 Tax=Cerina litoralis TaxID=2874477 RepID=A0AAE3EVY4_9FLAO|nr:hypothetical protein [Cerina litoralis]MCG2460672.1 hypothetical protein [Cerina litoralis]
MKNILAATIIVFLWTSCSNDDGIDTVSFPQKFVLVKMAGRVPDSERTGDDMDWQEYYIFDSDSTFLKSRNINNETIQAEGTYKTKVMNDDEYMILSYPKESEIIGSCEHRPTEMLFIIDRDHLRNTWGACDGPVLSYNRVK